jgi:hypothetical protein
VEECIVLTISFAVGRGSSPVPVPCLAGTAAARYSVFGAACSLSVRDTAAAQWTRGREEVHRAAGCCPFVAVWLLRSACPAEVSVVNVEGETETRRIWSSAGDEPG